MTKDEKVQYWLDIAKYDIDTAETLQRGGRYRRTLTRDEALELVRRYKRVISARFDVEPKVMMFGSYSKGYANPDSDIDVAVIVPTYGDRKFEISKKLWHDVDQVSFLIEPVLMAEDRQSPLYDDVMRTGVAV